MRIGLRSSVIAGTVMVAATSSWVSMQLALAQRHSDWAAAHLAEAHVSAAEIAKAHGLPTPQWSTPSFGAAYWRPLIVASTLQLLALSVVVVILVATGRRRVWLPLALAVFAYPTVATIPQFEMRPIGAAWASPIGGASTMANVGGLVDLLVVLLPAVAYLLTSRRCAFPNNPPTRRVVQMVAAPAVALAAVLATYGLAEVRGGADERVVAATLVLLTAGLLASTSLGVFWASVITTVAGVIAVQQGDLTSVPLVVTAALPLAAVALTGAVCAVHGPAIAVAYRMRVRRVADMSALST
jgi:hypothetical protein